MKQLQLRILAALAAPMLAFGTGPLAAGAPAKQASEETKGAPGTNTPVEAQAGSGPHLSIESETVDLGEILKGSTASAVFSIQNTGDQVLKILDARPG